MHGGCAVLPGPASAFPPSLTLLGPRSDETVRPASRFRRRTLCLGGMSWRRYEPPADGDANLHVHRDDAAKLLKVAAELTRIREAELVGGSMGAARATQQGRIYRFSGQQVRQRCNKCSAAQFLWFV
jgi:hypothetical protein